MSSHYGCSKSCPSIGLPIGVMEFASSGQRPRNTTEPDSLPENHVIAESYLRASHWVARPVALRSNDNPETSQDSRRMGFLCETPSMAEYPLPKKLRVSQPDTNRSSTVHVNKAMPGWESYGKAAIDSGGFYQQRNDLGISPTKTSTVKESALGAYGPQISPSIGQCDLMQMAPPAADQAYPTQGRPAEKRSAFREVAKRNSIIGNRQKPGTNVVHVPPRLHRREQHQERFKVSEHFLQSKVSLHRSSAPSQPLCGSPQTLLAVRSCNIRPNHHHYHHSGMELEEVFRTPSFLPLKRQPPTDYPKCALGREGVNTKTTSLFNDAFAVQFGTFQNGATAEQVSSLSFPWQQPLVPTSVLPLSSTVPGPQYDNWCAKCNASFRMTSDLVYHMRTQHKRSTTDGNHGGGAASSSTSSPADGFGGKRTEEKLKCDRCGETFRERHHLTRHMTSHNTDRE